MIVSVSEAGRQADALLLGSILNYPQFLDDVRDRVTPGHFATLDHQRIYTAILSCADRGQRPDFLNVTEHLESSGMEFPVSTVADLISSDVFPGEVPGYVDRVIHHWRRRMVLQATTNLVQQLHQQPDTDPVTLAQSLLTNLIETAGEEAGPQVYADVMELFQDRLDQQRAGIWEEALVPTGFRSLDYLLGGGLRPAETIFVGARPGMGKTAFALQLMHNAARHDQPVLLFSAEMSLTAMIERGVAEMSGLSMDDIRKKNIDQRTFERLMTITERMRTMPVGIDDTSAITTDQMLVRARRFQRQHGLAVVFFDYLELAGDANREGEEKRVGMIAQGMKRIAKELNVPTVTLSQLSRAVENSTPPIPKLSHLRQSGTIEAVADKVLMLYRQDYYVGQNHPGLVPDPLKAGVVDVKVEKNRNGPTGIASLRFDEKSMRFFDIDHQAHQQEIQP